MMKQAIISLGSNLGNRVLNLNLAIEKIQDLGVLKSNSAIYESAPWGFEAKKPFLNQVVEIETELDPFQLLKALLKIEDELGRKRTSGGYESRTIDLDLLFYEDEIFKSESLILPHPRISERMFVLQPLNEIMPQFNHPQLKKTIQQLLNECPDKLWVKKFIR